jgi:hypothetical protein
LSHVVYFVPDAHKAEAFYVERLGFVCTDRFVNTGPFLRPAGTLDHHTLFMIQTPPFMKGCEHFTFHLGGPTEVLQAGRRLEQKGYQTFWGPAGTCWGRTGSGTSTVRSVVTSSTTPTWTCTTTSGSRVKCDQRRCVADVPVQEHREVDALRRSATGKGTAP